MAPDSVPAADGGIRQDGDAFLGVESSLCGKRWRLVEADGRAALMLSQRLGVPESMGRILAARGIGAEEAPDFLDPRLKTLLPDPSVLKDMDKAACRLADAVIASQPIGIFGDYDVDGGTSSALLTRFLRAAGGRTMVHIPDRQKEGYGPNAPALLGLQKKGAGVVVTVDCGATAYEPLAEVRDAGLDVVVVDHHVGETRLPPAHAVVNPNRLDEDGRLGNLAAVGVAFLLTVAVNRELRGRGWYTDRPAPNPLDWLDLVALGTVCDVVPLTGVNRALVAQGLKVMAARRNVGLKALADAARIDAAPGCYHLGFIFGPRINAGGRVGKSDLGVRLLTTEDANEARALAQTLDRLNGERQAIEATVLEGAIRAAEDAGEAAATICGGDGWHPGVVGIVASRLVERFNRPACVVGFGDDGVGVGTGSGRSVPGVDLGAAIIAAKQAGLLVAGGGHPMAAGFKVEKGKFAGFQTFLAERLGRVIAETGFVPELKLDGALKPAGCTAELIATLERLQPFGPGNAEPRFVLPSVRVAWADRAGENHVRLRLQGEDGRQLPAIAFRALDGPLGRAFLESAGAPLHVAGKLRLNTWQGRSEPQLIVDDAAPAW